MKRALDQLLPKERQAVEEFRNRVADVLGSNLVSIKLFGSKARGEGRKDSDVDVFITVKKRSPVLEDQIYDIAFDVDIRYGVYISPRLVSVAVLRHPVWRVTPFLRNVAREGLAL